MRRLDNGDLGLDIHLDSSMFEDDVEAVWEAINADPVRKYAENIKAFLSERFLERDAMFAGKEVEYPIEEQIANCYKYLNWTDSHKNPFDMTEEDLRAAETELAECYPGITWVAHAGYRQMVPQEKEHGKLILT